MVDYFASVFGPYPFGEYGEVTVDRDLGYALETQTLALFARDMLGTDADGASSSSPTSWPTSGSATRWGSGAGPTSG